MVVQTPPCKNVSKADSIWKGSLCDIYDFYKIYVVGYDMHIYGCRLYFVSEPSRLTIDVSTWYKKSHGNFDLAYEYTNI